VETFYQRLLAGDPDEALDQAESALKTISLSHYYDDVVLPGLRLATNDMERGVMGPDRLEVVRDTIASLLRDLAHQGDADPPSLTPDKPEDQAAKSAASTSPLPSVPGLPEELPSSWQNSPILCIAGRGPLDDWGASMLAQLLAANGLQAKIVPYEAVSRFAIDTLGPTDARMICVCYLEIGGSPPDLRFLLRRLRQQIPQVPILVGFWAAQDPILTVDRLRVTLGADYYATSLRDSVAACLRTARAATEPEMPASIASVVG
jgi:hypothetical protein